MTELLTLPPPPDVIAAMSSIGVRMVPTVLATQQGPDGHLGPEAAGAVLILQATFSDEARAGAFWRTAGALMERLATAPGFIRRYSFADGPNNTLIALWRTAADANMFFNSDEHQAAMRELFRHRWQYSHFAALWETTSTHQRMIFCEDCDAVTATPAERCTQCGADLTDIYATPPVSDGDQGVDRKSAE